jgi:hypothetical protein
MGRRGRFHHFRFPDIGAEVDKHGRHGEQINVRVSAARVRFEAARELG